MATGVVGAGKLEVVEAVSLQSTFARLIFLLILTVIVRIAPFLGKIPLSTSLALLAAVARPLVRRVVVTATLSLFQLLRLH